MGHFGTLNDFVTKCQETQRVMHLWHNTLDFLHERKIKMVSYHSDDAQQSGSERLGLVVSGFPDSWVCQYLEAELFLCDPIPQIAAITSRPFLWSDAPKLMRLTPEAENYIQLLKQSGLGDGLAMQVFGPNMRNAYVGLGFGGENPNLTPEEIFELQCAVQIAHIRYCELTEHRQAKPGELTPREIEILQWIARGKSNSVIAEILGISRHTVDTLTRRIFDKLDVSDRTTAAIRGLGAGLVRYRHGNVA